MGDESAAKIVIKLVKLVIETDLFRRDSTGKCKISDKATRMIARSRSGVRFATDNK